MAIRNDPDPMRLPQGRPGDVPDRRMTRRRHHRRMTTEQPQTAPSPRLLRRRATDRVIGGVAAGIADYLNIDPVLVRAVFVGLVVFGGAGVVLYLGTWLLIPVEGQDQSPFEQALQRVGRLPGLLLIIAAAAFLFLIVFPSVNGGFYIDGWMVGILVLVVIGIFLLRRGGPATGTAAASPAIAPATSGRCGRTHRRRGTAILCRAATAGSPFAAGLVHHRRHPDRHRRGSPARTDLRPGPAAGPILRPGADGDRRGPAHRLVVGTRPRADPARAVGVAAGPPGRVHDGAAGGRCRRPVLRADEHGGARR